MSPTRKSGSDTIKLPHPSTSPKVKKNSPPYALLNPNGGEIYKVDARYPTQPPTRQCRFMIYWTGGPAGAATSISLIDVKNWVVIASIWSGTNVGAGELGSAEFTLPANFKPTDDCSTPSTYPLKPGIYQVYIQDDPATTWTYGPEFTIVWGY